jgi:hypothetical protein
MKDRNKVDKDRRSMLTGTGLAAGMLAGGAAFSILPAEARAETEISSSAKKKCATCRYWGGVRRISKDGETVVAEGKGWCNNPDSPAYQKQTKPTQGAPVWTRWDALG